MKNAYKNLRLGVKLPFESKAFFFIMNDCGLNLNKYLHQTVGQFFYDIIHISSVLNLTRIPLL